MRPKRCSSVFFAVLVLIAGVSAFPATAQIQVDSANPSAAPQGTINLDIAITGKGFQKGAQAQWFVTGTTNPGGVTVNSTTFKGSTQLTANITVAQDAVIGGFDILVKNTNGRTGKGTDKFAVTAKGTPVGCSTSGTPTGFILVAQLNTVQPNGEALITTLRWGHAVRVRPLDLDHSGSVDTLVAVVTSGQGSQASYAFFLDPDTGVPQVSNPVTHAPWQNPLLLLTGAGSAQLAVGDANGDGMPDFLKGDVSYLFVGSLSGPPSYTPSYTAYPISAPAGAPSYFGAAVAMGDLDGDGKDELVIGAPSPDNRDKTTSAVLVFKFDPSSNSVKYAKTISDPTGSSSNGFGGAIAVGNVDGQGGNDLVVGPGLSVFPGPISWSPAVTPASFTLTGPGPGFGENLGIADLNLDGASDLLVITGDKFSGNTAQALIYPSSVASSQTFTHQLLPDGLSYSWAAPNIDVGNLPGTGAVVVGAPNANNGSCQYDVGAVHLFTGPFAASQSTNYIFEPPTLQSSNLGYGFGVGLVPGYPFVLIGEHYRDVGNTLGAGQVYVYKFVN